MVAQGFREAFEQGEAYAIQGLHAKAVDSFAKALDFVASEEAPKAFAVAGLKAGEQAHRAGWHEEALSFFQKVASCQDVPIELRLRASTHRSVLAMGCSDIKDAHEALTQSLKLAQDAGDVAAEAQHQGNLGLVLLRMGEVRAARASLYEAAKLYGEAGDIRNQAQSWNALGNVLLRLGDAEAAETHFKDAYNALKQNGAEQQSAIPLANIAHLMRRRGQTDEALELYRTVHAAMVGQGDLGAGSLLDVAMAELDRGGWKRAGEHLKEARSLAKSAAMHARIDFVRIDWLSEVGDLDGAFSCAERILGTFEERGDIQGIVGVRLSQARIKWMLGEQPDPFPDEVYRAELPELRIAVQSLNAERAFAGGDLSTARSIVSSFEEDLLSLKHLNRVRRVKLLMLTMDLLEEKGEASDLCREFLEISRELGQGGNLRDLMAATNQMVLPLILLGHYEEAIQVLEPVRKKDSDSWPILWNQNLNRLYHLLQVLSGSSTKPYSAPQTEIVASKSVDQLISAIENRNCSEIKSICRDLESKQRQLLANLFEKCAQRLDLF